MSEGRPTSARRGYDAKWRKRAAEQLKRQPWCELCCCAYGPQIIEWIVRRPDKATPIVTAFVTGVLAGRGIVAGVTPSARLRELGIERADTVDHRKPRRTFAPELQGSDAPGGSEHPDNLRSLCHSCHSRRADDKARRARG